jgi:hypothetical protein
MPSSLQDRWSEVKSEWRELERHKRIEVVWSYANLAATFILPVLLLFVFIISAPRIPSANTLLVLITIGLIYGGSVIFQGSILNYLKPNQD